jgi:hypothetical protein
VKGDDRNAHQLLVLDVLKNVAEHVGRAPGYQTCLPVIAGQTLPVLAQQSPV